MITLKLRVVILAGILLSIAGCVNAGHQPDISHSPSEDNDEWICESLPLSFRESDLYGKWEVRYGDSTIERLIINDDNTYKQVFKNTITGYIYESDPNSWWVEIKDNQGTYLHLKNMLFCELRDSCVPPEDAHEIDFFDVCSGQWIDLTGEIVLVIIGDTGIPDLIDAPPRNIALLRLRPPGLDGPPFRFRLVE